MRKVAIYVVSAVLLVGLFGGAMMAFAAAEDFGGRGQRFDRAAFQDGDGFFQRGGDGEARGEGRHGRRGRGVGGEVTAIDGSTLTVENRNGDSITVNTNDDTTVMLVESQTEGSLSDITIGSHIGVRGQRNDDGSVEARGIMVAPEGDKAGGKVSAVDNGTITVENRDGEATTITTNGDTEFRVGRDETGSIEDVTVDRGVMAVGELQENGSLAARLVFVHDGRKGHGDREGATGGEVTAIDGTSFTIENRNDETITVNTNDDTEYRTRGDEDVSFADIEVGGKVMVKGEPVEGAENTILAEMIGIKGEKPAAE